MILGKEFAHNKKNIVNNVKLKWFWPIWLKSDLYLGYLIEEIA